MMKGMVFKICVPILLFFICFFFVKNNTRVASREEEREDHALDAFEFWYNQRAIPYDAIPKDNYLRAVQYVQTAMAKEQGVTNKFATDGSAWVSIGPNNVGGRTLSITISPNNHNIVWAGSASGGLWKSVNGGFGPDAWTYVNTGYPTLAVSSIAIDPLHPDTIYIGTGEVGAGYQFRQIGTPGARSTYGLGILKSTDGGTSWILTGLVWTFSQISAVQKIVINPQNPNTLYAATTEGTYKTADGGGTWTKVHSVLMAMDIVINPIDTTVLYAAYGQRNTTANPGLYKTSDAGATWTKLTGGLPTAYFGRTALSIYPPNPQIVYAGISDAYSSTLLGLYKTTDGGATWSLMTRTNYLGSQGWYDNTIAVSPADSSIVYCAGLDIYKSTDGGDTLLQKSYWFAGLTGVIENGGPEGTALYTHADHHTITIDPTDPQRIYFGNDGGVFFSGDGAATFRGCNGGYVTTQFYNGFANAVTDSLIALGGLQDNGSIKYEGSKLWNKVFGGDGGWCAIDPTNAGTLYEEYVYLTISQSTDGGDSWSPRTSGLPTGGTYANFIAPFVICPSNPSVLYAGAKIVYRSDGGGDYWYSLTSPESFNGTSVSCIGVSYVSTDTVLAGTGGSTSGGAAPKFEIFATTTGGEIWTNVTHTLPQRYPTDISFDPNSGSTCYLTYSGYGTPHVFRTSDIGQSWTDISSNLPDIPVQSVVVDPAYSNNIYVGTDLGVFRTLDGGTSWHQFDNGMPPAMVLDLGISPKNRMLRAATFGNGVYERSLPKFPAAVLSSYRQRWNMLSVPVRVADYRKSTLFPNAASAAYSFERTYTEHDTLQNGIGYFLKFPSPQTVTFTGNPISRDTIIVRKGWNLIGSISDSISTSAVESIPAGISDSSAYYSFDGGYQASFSIQPGKGYWTKVSQDGMLILNSPGISKQNKVARIAHDVPNFLNSLMIEDATGNHQTLYFGEQNEGVPFSSYFDLPPVPPPGIFDMRFASQKLVELYGSASQRVAFPLQIHAESYPLSVSWVVKENNDVQYELRNTGTKGDFPTTTLKGNGKLTIIDPSVAFLEIRVKNNTGSVPKEFALEQNFPNPFNPSTVIRYHVSEKSKVTIRVYDILGNEVKTLIDELQESGVGETQWDGTNTAGTKVSTGVYICRFSSVSLVDGRLTTLQKKMVLLK